ncbi:cupin domain-containing protein [Methylobacterium sp. WCS2018Hpa-22]|uniref:cupin domain-containing protein n=1 Tax=unclassified Methylobacterium TaxID=2615210 RepID=UPI002889AE35|nr:cupin domain-containing protein [Methylobacterium sp. WCS2018Hpa-22]
MSIAATTQVLVNIDPSGSKSGQEIRGPATLGSIVDGECLQVLDVFMTNEKGNFLAGVWTCTAGTMKLTDYPFNEMAVVIEGSIVVTDEDSGVVQEFGPGDGLAIRKGFRGTWHMPSAVLKRFAAEIPD